MSSSLAYRSEPVRLELPSRPALVGDDVTPTDSPARLLHERLVESFASPAARAETRLSGSARLAILCGSAALLWTAIGGAVLALA